jgi:DNA repair protein RadA/Sms
VEQRIMEADKLGFEQIYISNQNLKGLDLKKFNLEIKAVNSVVEILNELFNS